jgi:hypothetical protein
VIDVSLRHHIKQGIHPHAQEWLCRQALKSPGKRRLAGAARAVEDNDHVAQSLAMPRIRPVSSPVDERQLARVSTLCDKSCDLGQSNN